MLETISTPCSFDVENFEAVMLNLIRNPNITSSVVFRADILWDSVSDSSFDPDAASSDRLLAGDKSVQLSSFIKHMRAELRPRVMSVDGFKLRRTMVRQMIPRNTKLDKSLAQTCHFFSRRSEVRSPECEEIPDGEHAEDDQDEHEEEDNLLVYLPHVQNEAEIPFYHPKVKALCFLHNRRAAGSSQSKLSIHISLFPLSETCPEHLMNPNLTSPAPAPAPSADRLARTLQKLLSTIHRHGNGLASGYQKRVHHDRLIPQARVQDTYTRLKNAYAKDLLDTYWQEQTDATKGIFEDLGIAAFCIELWRSMYQCSTSSSSERIERSDWKAKLAFPGFVDIGCGNGVLTFILLSEGYPGWGFDARARRTWAAFPPAIRSALHERILVPSIFADPTPDLATTTPELATTSSSSANSTSLPEITSAATAPSPSLATPHGPIRIHDGTFPPGTFIISNHADELTIWTPLLAYLSHSPFIAIPCCSHDLSGAKRRFPAPPPAVATTRSSTPEDTASDGSERSTGIASSKPKENANRKGEGVRPTPPPSAYATLCSAVSRLASSVGYSPEEEVLRIPSTRNTAIVGRRWKSKARDAQAAAEVGEEEGAGKEERAEGGGGNEEGKKGKDGEEERQKVDLVPDSEEEREDTVRRIVQHELGGRGIEEVGREWRERAVRIAGSRGTRDVVGGH